MSEEKINLAELKTKFRNRMLLSPISKYENSSLYSCDTICYKAPVKKFSGLKEFYANLPEEILVENPETWHPLSEEERRIIVSSQDQGYGKRKAYGDIEEELRRARILGGAEVPEEIWELIYEFTPGDSFHQDETHHFKMAGKTRRYYFYLEIRSYVIH